MSIFSKMSLYCIVRADDELGSTLHHQVHPNQVFQFYFIQEVFNDFIFYVYFFFLLQ